jgi:hypothetical protein
MESMETTCPGRAPFGKKVKTLAIGVLATAALSIPAVSAVSVVGHAADRFAPVRFNPWGSNPGHGVSPDSQRIALGVKPDSLRLT